MNQIRPWLYIGNYYDTRDQIELMDKGVGAVLQLAEPVPYGNILNLYLPVEDGYPLERVYWERGVSFIREHHQKTMLIACGAGISRSATFCMIALKEIEGLSLPKAFRVVKAARSMTMPHSALWESICQFYEEYPPYLDTVMEKYTPD
jgi:hypothetical protein